MLRALVVDDDVTSQSALAALVRDEGFEVERQERSRTLGRLWRADRPT